MKKQAELYRMVTDEHICPYGIKAKDLLKKKGFDVDDHHLKSAKQTDVFKKQHQVKTTPQVFIQDERIGGFTDLQKYFGIEPSSNKTVKKYAPVVAIFTMTFLIAMAIGLAQSIEVFSIEVVETFIALSMCVLAIQKLQDLEAFSLQFLGYDLLAQRVVSYSYVYPFAEAAAGVGMLSKQLPILFGSISFFIGAVGAASVFKAVYIDKRKLKCACVGGNSEVPLGFVSLTENLMMISMGLWMVLKSQVF